MAGLGTIVNVLSIIVAGIIGLIGGKLLNSRLQEGIIMACGVCTIFIGIGGAMQQMLVVSGDSLETGGSLMLIVSLVAGTLAGEILQIEQRLEGFGEWLKKKSGNSKDPAFVNGFVTASLTVCIGAMAVVGSIRDGIAMDHSILFTKSILDFIIILIMASSLGKGCIFSAVSVGVFQGSMTVLSRLIQPFMTDAALANLSFTGSVMICCVGINLVWGKKIRVGNMLPGLVIAVVWALV